MEPEYFFREAVRWSFGFANPNKAAVLFACLLPVAWAAWTASWKVRGVSRILASLFTGGLVLGIGFCLMMTYSRGGILAGGLALAFLWLAPLKSLPRRMSAMPWSRKILSGLMVLILLGMFVWLGAGARSVEAIAEDASVGNRVLLWQKALLMAVENPGGFGGGNSGRAYMQWYQPLAMTAGYRTMVNSYLTFLVEQGWLRFLGAVFGFLVFWLWVSQGNRGRTIDGWRRAASGVWVAFLTAAVFSTTAEEMPLWILPVLAAVFLAGMAWRDKNALSGQRLAAAAALTVAFGSVLWSYGFLQCRSEPLERAFGNGRTGEMTVGVARRTGGLAREAWWVFPDSEVLGPVYGKQLRALCEATGAKLVVSSGAPDSPLDRILVGAAVEEAENVPVDVQVLLAPAAVDREKARALLASAKRTILMVPDIDQDGRVAFWRELAQGHPGVEVVKLEGVGTQIDWAWDQVVMLLPSA